MEDQNRDDAIVEWGKRMVKPLKPFKALKVFKTVKAYRAIEHEVNQRSETEAKASSTALRATADSYDVTFEFL